MNGPGLTCIGTEVGKNMDRPTRRFIPAGISPTESLEERLCMSVSQLTGGLPGMGQAKSSASVAGYGSTSNPWAVRRQTRIDRLPGSLNDIDPTQHIPPAIVAAIQNDLQQIIGTITGKAFPDQRQAMNSLLKAMVPQQGVSQQSAAAINRLFGQMITAAGANPTVATSLQNHMMQLTQAAIANSTQPSFAVSNDYIFMYYVTTTVGWAIPTPGAPHLLPKLNQNPNGAPVTSSRRPQFNGTYFPNMNVQIMDVSTGQIVGKAVTNSKGQFTTSSSMVMNPGTYVLTAQGKTAGGEYSQFSPYTVLTITSGPTRRRG